MMTLAELRETAAFSALSPEEKLLLESKWTSKAQIAEVSSKALREWLGLHRSGQEKDRHVLVERARSLQKRISVELSALSADQLANEDEELELALELVRRLLARRKQRLKSKEEGKL